MFGIRTPTKVTTPTPQAIEREEREGLAPVQPQTPTLTPAVRKSIGELEAAIAQSAEGLKKQKQYKNRLTEAAAVQQSALLQLDAAQNFKGEIKAAVTSAVKRLYELVKEADSQTKEGRDKRKEKEGGSEEVLEKETDKNKTYNIDTTPQAKMYQMDEHLKRLEKETKKLEDISKLLQDNIKQNKRKPDAILEDQIGQKILCHVEENARKLEEIKEKMGEQELKEIKMLLETQTEKTDERDRNIEERIERTYANVVASNSNTVQRQQPFTTINNQNRTNHPLTYKPKTHKLVVKSNSQETNSEIYERIRSTVDPKTTGLRNIPTYDTVRGGKVFKSHVDITACTTDLLAVIDDWRVEEGLVSSDHNAITFKVRLERSKGRKKGIERTTRKYNTRKANCFLFERRLTALLEEAKINTGEINKVSNKKQLEEMVAKSSEAAIVATKEAVPEIKKRSSNTLPCETRHARVTTPRRKRPCTVCLAAQCLGSRGTRWGRRLIRENQLPQFVSRDDLRTHLEELCDRIIQSVRRRNRDCNTPAHVTEGDVRGTGLSHG
ncbi:unnamed protein product [Pieris brassicae]|uniref:Endonuclease/exonuclease/phosphatase domain-containing protein n=1 Tax=Pieris brassicae TaxID=7116 RepID=A0A9P0TCN8_PIEBR|nr:unnamed protein product [Pieris brassicae]